jgi:hypothetical protein
MTNTIQAKLRNGLSLHGSPQIKRTRIDGSAESAHRKFSDPFASDGKELLLWLVTLKPRLPSRGFCCRPPLSFPSDSRFAATCLILPLLCPSRISDTPAVLRRTFSAVRPASRRRAISCSAAPGDQGKGVIAGYYATFGERSAWRCALFLLKRKAQDLGC